MAGIKAGDVVVSDDPRQLGESVLLGRPTVATRPEVLAEVEGLDQDAETDATVGCAIKARADQARSDLIGA